MRYLLFFLLYTLGLSATAQDVIAPAVGDNVHFYALLIAAQNYQDNAFPSLHGPYRDAQALRTVLTTSYNFEPGHVTVLADKSKDEILDAVETTCKRLNPDDNLLIFYAGHGTYTTGINAFDVHGYLVPTSAKQGKFYTYISSDELTGSFRQCKSKHILVIADACFGGSLARRAIPSAPLPIQAAYNRNSRQLMASGNITPVPDNSVFIQYFIQRLEENDKKYITINDLFQQIVTPTINNTNGLTYPVCNPFFNVGDEDGRFVFKRTDGRARELEPVASTTTPPASETYTGAVNPSTPATATRMSLDKAKDLLKAGNLLEAKNGIDFITSQDKNLYNGEAWYTRLKIYNALAASNYSSQYPDARDQAFIALRRYTEVDNSKLVLLIMDGYKPVNEIYQGYFQMGANDYNAGKYDEALKNFSGAISTSSFMTQKGWTNLPIDTTSTLYAGISAEKAGKKDFAAIYYGRLAEAGIRSINGTNMLDVYKWLVDYYNTKKDDANYQKFIALAKQQFPDDLFWPSTELDNLRAAGNKKALFAKYEEIVAHFPSNHLFFFNYGLELYQYATDANSGRPADYDALIARALVMLQNCLKIKPDYPQAALVCGQIYYNTGVDLQTQTKNIPGKDPEAVKRRADLRIEAGKQFDMAIPYFEQVDSDLGGKGKLTMEEKATLKNSYNLLITIYENKNISDRVNTYTTKFNNVDKDH